ncbi:tripartite motif-containing protein 16 [Silurus asotus]|uniref:Tripartite motif-containing protein 16 n=1 Tax=Silurus asotus TaxID=30991 RepID=A0AAD5AH74_SILAS|nr:tripartite motif-containing protein 16 [Silurus asotus]
MAEANIVERFSRDQFSCPLCLELLTDPVTTQCGHSYCKVCINFFWDKEDQKGVYSCPQCRDTFTPRPSLRRNNMLVKVVEKIKSNEIQDSVRCAEDGDVECDFCTERKHKALKSCLMCLASFCEDHIKPHLERPAFKKHTLIKASSKLQEKICSQHGKLIEIYCRTDQRCICSLCMLENHSGHKAVSLLTERTEKQNELKEEQKTSHQRIQQKQKKMQELKQNVYMIKSNARTAVEDSEKIFTEMISSVEEKRMEVMELIRAQEQAELNQAEQLLEQLEQEITVLQRRVNELEQLSHTHDNLQFLQNFQSLSVSSGWESLCISSHTVQHLSFDGLRNSLSDLKKRFEEFCEEEFNKIPPHDFCYLTLDPETAHHDLCLSEKNRVVTFNEKSETYSRRKQLYSKHLDRFDSCWQVLCKESVCGRCHWEVEWSGDVHISVSYKKIRRNGGGKDCRFGLNSQSWSLWCSPSSISFYHDDVKTELGVPSSSRIAVYLDFNAGILSFYSLSETMRLLHRVHTKFTQPLYAGFRVYGGTVRLCDSK